MKKFGINFIYKMRTLKENFLFVFHFSYLLILNFNISKILWGNDFPTNSFQLKTGNSLINPP